jgi:hypothetical protein
MRYPENPRCDTSAKERVEFLKNFRSSIEALAEDVESMFGEHPEARDVIKSLIEARMWSGNLFGYCDVEDLNRKRDEG